MIRRFVNYSLVILSCLVTTSATEADQWTRFRGPNGSGVSKATTVPVRWTEEDYNWKVSLPGVGHSSPVVWKDRIYVTSGDEASSRRFVMCFRAADGKQLFKRDFEATDYRKHKLNSLASGTPAVDDKHIYICWGDSDKFTIMGLDHEGRDVWQRHFEPFKSGHGDGVSPVAYEDLVVFPHEHSGDSSLIAVNRLTGETRWRVPRKSNSNWSTPCVQQRPDANPEMIFTNWKSGITAIDLDSGRQSWQADVFDKGHTESSISSPIVAGDLVLGISGWMGVRIELIAVRPQENGRQLDAEKIYCIDRSVPLCTTPLATGDLLFLWSDEGIVSCFDITTGKMHWRKRVGGKYYSSPICVGASIYNISADGEVVVLSASSEFKEQARNSVGEPSHSTPAVSNGVLYIRTFSHLMSLGGK